MINLKNKATGEFIGVLTEPQLKYLIDELEEEHDEDRDYWLNRTQLEMFREQGAEFVLVDMLEMAMGESDELEVIWERSL